MYPKRLFETCNAKPLEKHRFCQCGVVSSGIDNYSLISYDTVVIEVYDGTMYINGLYSQTTKKHIVYFLEEYYPKVNFKNVKYAYEHHLNITVGLSAKYVEKGRENI